MRYTRTISIFLFLFCGMHPVVGADVPQVTGDQVIEHLNRTITWYEHVMDAQQPGSESEALLLQNEIRQAARQVVQTAFAFGRAQAAFLANQKGASTGSSTGQSSTLEQAAAASNNRIEHLQSQIAELNQEIQKANRHKLPALTAQRDTLAADLAFAKTTQNAVKELLKFASLPEQSAGLTGQINLLAATDSIPSALSDIAQPGTPAGSNTQPTVFHPESAGIAQLVANTFSLLRARSQIDALIKETENLNAGTRNILAPLRTRLRGFINQADSLAAATAEESDLGKLASTRKQVDAMSRSFKALSVSALPLSEQGIALQNTRANLEEWRNEIGGKSQTILRYLVLRLGTVAVSILLLLIISEIVRRATFRYVRDTRLRRQFVLMRRFLVGTLSVLMVLLATVSSLGSFATIAGLLTAGLAVALQNVILSIVAYFFLIGRYGLRTGDRVTVSGVTGQVLEVGLVRLYLMELTGAGTDVHSTGRIAVFSNSVIFQPSALIKQAPGTEYAWHTITATFMQDTELEQARKRLESAVGSVFQTYREVIRRQHDAFERAANIQLADPEPVGRARFADSGVEVSVRYPVTLQNMSDLDQRMLDAVLNDIAKAPELKISSGGFPRISAAS